jgi:putative transposase
VGRKTVETIFLLSAQQVAGEQTPGKASGEIRWHGSQTGRVALAERDLRMKRPRLRHKTEGEVKVPAYEPLRQNPQTADGSFSAATPG